MDDLPTQKSTAGVLMDVSQHGELEVTLATGALFGRYVILDKLGSGGQGVVFAAWDQSLGRRVALKLLQRHHADDEVERAKLQREARALAQLNHPNVVAVYELGEERGNPYLALELVEGTSLGSLLKKNRPPPDRIVQLLVQAGKGLAAIHKAGFVHRDFKPGNVLIGNDGRVCITDFGLARSHRVGVPAAVSLSGDEALLESSDNAVSDDSLTQDGLIAGTLRYLAPEQLEGLPPDARSDQFAFGVTLWVALLGGPPFADAVRIPTQRIALIRGGPPVEALGKVPRRLRPLLLRALAADPAKRFPSMDELLAELSGDRQRRRRRRLLAGLTIAAVPAAVAAGVWLGSARQSACAAEARLKAVWTLPQRQAVVAAVKTVNPDAADAVGQELDGWFQRWALLDSATCLAERAKSLPETHGRRACLSTTLQDAQALIRLFTTADAQSTVLQEAAIAVRGLPTLQACVVDDVQLTPTPTTPEARAPVLELLSQARAAHLAGESKKGLVSAEGAVHAAKSLSDDALLAAALLQRARANEAAANLEQAKEDARNAVTAAVRGKDPRVEAEAWVHLLSVLANRLRQHQEAAVLEPFARAAVQRDGRDEVLGDFDLALGPLHAAQGRDEEAAQDFARALERALARTPVDARRMARIDTMLGVAYLRVDRIDDSRFHAQRAVATLKGLVPDHHPLMVAAQNNLAGVLMRMGKLSDALGVLKQAQAAITAKLGETHVSAAALNNNIGELEVALGRFDDAEVTYGKALKQLVDTVGLKHVRTTIPQLGLAKVALARGQVAEARAKMKAVLKLRTELAGPQHLDTRSARAALAELELEAGNLKEAKVLLGDVKSLPGQAKQLLEALVSECVLALAERKPDEALKQLAETRDYATKTKDRSHAHELDVLDKLARGEPVDEELLFALPPSGTGRTLLRLAKQPLPPRLQR